MCSISDISAEMLRSAETLRLSPCPFHKQVYLNDCESQKRIKLLRGQAKPKQDGGRLRRPKCKKILVLATMLLRFLRTT